MTTISPKTLAKEIYDDKLLSPFTEKQRVHIAYNLALEIELGKIKRESMAERIKTIEIPDFQNGTPDAEIDVNLLTINKKIEYYYNKGLTPREIMDKVGKTYTRVKNIIKKLRDQL